LISDEIVVIKIQKLPFILFVDFTVTKKEEILMKIAGGADKFTI
jgi:hypothetical protein